MSKFFERLISRAGSIDSVLCVGLDPRIPRGEQSAKALFDVNRRIIDATVDQTLCYKPNIAFYEQHGPQGLVALSQTIEYIPDEIPVLLDAKRGDIGATAEAYAAAAVDLGADAITLSPYMGHDSVLPFLEAGLAVFVLCRTSNPGGRDFQVLPSGRLPFYRTVAATALGWSENVGLVVAANSTNELGELRALHPESWFLAPGIGAQGGSMTEAVAAGARSDGTGILPVVARGIASASDPQKAAAALVTEYRQARDLASATAKDAAQRTAEKRVPRQAPDIPAAVREGLLDAILETGCFRTGSFVLKSGVTSPFYIDLRRLQSSPKALRAAAEAYHALLARALDAGRTCDRLAAVPVAAISLTTALALRTELPLIYPRLPAKPHGSGNRIEGEWESGETAVLIDDLITTGKSKLEAVAVLREEGLVADTLLVLIERGAQGRRDMVAAGVELHAAASINELVDRGVERGLVSSEDASRVQGFLEDDQ